VRLKIVDYPAEITEMHALTDFVSYKEKKSFLNIDTRKLMLSTVSLLPWPRGHASCSQCWKNFIGHHGCFSILSCGVLAAASFFILA
jgi:hypothetical protein